MLDAWYGYLAKYADLKATMICSLPDLKGSSMMNISDLRLFSQQKAQQHLSFHQISAILKKFEEEEWRIRADLVIKVSQLLSPLQATYLRLVNISSSDVRTVFGIILGLEWDSSEALSTASRPSKFAEETLKALVLSGDT